MVVLHLGRKLSTGQNNGRSLEDYRSYAWDAPLSFSGRSYEQNRNDIDKSFLIEQMDLLHCFSADINPS